MGEPACIDDEIPFEVPEGWEWARLESVAYVAAGKTPSKDSFVEEGIPYFKMYNLRGQRIDFDFQPQYIRPEVHYKTLAKSRIHPGDLIMNIVGPPLGKLAIVPERFSEANTNQAAVVIRPNPRGIPVEWLFYYLSEMTAINRIATRGSAGQLNISLTQSKSLLVPVPPLAEQRRIVAELGRLLSLVGSVERDSADLGALRARARAKVLDLAVRGRLVPQDPSDEPASALLARAAVERRALVGEGRAKAPKGGWSVIERRSDGTHYEKRGDGEPVPVEVPYDLPEGWAWARLGVFSDFGYAKSVAADTIPDNAWILDLEDIEEGTGRVLQHVKKRDRQAASAKRPFVHGQLLYSKLRPYLNKVLIADSDGFCTTEIMPIHLYGLINPEFVCLCLMSPYFLEYANRCAYGCKMPRLSPVDGASALVPIPPLYEQRRIVDRVKAVIALMS